MKLKLLSLLLLASSLAALGETEEQLNKHFPIQSGGRLVVDVDFGSIDVQTNSTSEVIVDVLRKISRGTRAAEEEFLAARPVTFSHEGNTVTIHSRANSKTDGSSRGRQRTEAKYSITVPGQFSVQLKTAGGAIAVSDLDGEVRANTSGGGLKFQRLHGPVDASTSGGPIRVADCAGALKLNTSGGAIDVAGGSGSFAGTTAGGSVAVKNFHGDAEIKSSGGGLTVVNVAGKVTGSTSGGPISASFASPLSGALSLETSGGGVTLRVPEDSAFDLDASTFAGRVSSELSVSASGKPSPSRLKGPVNGGGQPVVLRTSGGNIQVRKL